MNEIKGKINLPPKENQLSHLSLLKTHQKESRQDVLEFTHQKKWLRLNEILREDIILTILKREKLNKSLGFG